jgi:hypothetical protein
LPARTVAFLFAGGCNGRVGGEGGRVLYAE